MDKARAHKWFAELVDHQVGQWIVTELLGYGKSAIVTKASSGDTFAALKIFEPELVERFGFGVQQARIEREKSLIGAKVPNLVSVLDGGKSGDYLFVVMELLPAPWRPLAKALTDIPRERIRPILSQLAEAARGLEELGIVHRDIKPENIMIDGDHTRVSLLDLGVMKHFGEKSITDEDSRPFIGTLRYSSPEFLLRQETDSPEGWRALTFYQLGGVLHDLIMRRPLFTEFSEPFAQLVKAVSEHVPSIDSPDVHTDLILLCRNCLIKDPSTRLKCVQWSSFSEPTASPIGESARERVKTRFLGSSSQATVTAEQSRRIMVRTRDSVMQSLKSVIRETMEVDEFPLFTLTDTASDTGSIARCRLCFGPSPSHSLQGKVDIEFELQVIDAAAKVCKLTSQSVGSTEELFIGVFEHEAVRLPVRDQIYLLMDQSQI